MSAVVLARIDDIIDGALVEDAPWGDPTSEVFVPVEASATAALVAREPGVMSGAEVFARVFARVDPTVEVVSLVANGTLFASGDVLAKVSGPARSVLRAERIALNLTQRMTGIATLTAQYVHAISGTGARIVDTRKTTPGLRVIERQAVRDGGGVNHRHSLSDAVMAKDNHLAVLSSRGIAVGDAIRAARAQLGHTVHLEVEVDRIDQIEAVVAADVDTIMLDNFSVPELVEGERLVARRAIVEASGGVTLATVRAIAETGVDVISVGALTHSARNLDLGLDLELRG